MAELDEDRSKAGERGTRSQHQERNGAVIIDRRALTDGCDRCVRRGAIAQHQVKQYANIPAE